MKMMLLALSVLMFVLFCGVVAFVFWPREDHATADGRVAKAGP
jgi:cbb3-type cytochrome oxidase subunit 3